MSVYCVINQTMRLSDPTKKVWLSTPLAYTNQLAHAFRVTVLAEDGDGPADLTGVGCAGQFMSMVSGVDTISPISGTVDVVAPGVCEVVLPQSCYLHPGRFRFTMDITGGGGCRTALWVEGQVERNTTDSITDPGTPVGNITQAIANANAAASAANSAASDARAIVNNWQAATGAETLTYLGITTTTA